MMKLVFILSAIVFTTLHPLHVSVTEITFDEKERELEIMVRVFIDDLELAIQAEKKNTTLDLFNPAGSTTDKLVREYLQSKFTIAVDGRSQPVNYLGHETDGDALVLYIQVQPVKKWKSIGIKNSMLTELYEDQSNLVNVTYTGKTKSLRLVRDTPAGILAFDVK